MRSSETYFPTTSKCAIGARSAFLLIFLAACASSQQVVSTRTVREYPPQSLLVLTPHPPLDSVVYNRDLWHALLDYRDALRSCNADKSSISSWAIEKTAGELK